MPRRAAGLSLCLSLGLALGGCAGIPAPGTVDDPFEGLNREVHRFNKDLDRRLLRPAATAYDAATPGLVQLLVKNALNHLETPRDLVSHLLSGEIRAAGAAVMRFGVNTVVGAGGLLDPATDFGLEKDSADIGQALAQLGMAEGIYYEAPLLGPTVARHTLGRLVDMALSPLSYLAPPVGLTAEYTARSVVFRAENAAAVDGVLYGGVDSYAAARSIYLQSRRGALRRKQPDETGAGDLDLILE